MAAVNATMNALKAAGVVFVPFDSGDFTDAANIAWAGVPESDNYMEPEATARYCVSQLLCCTVLHCTALHCTVLYCTVLYCLDALS